MYGNAASPEDTAQWVGLSVGGIEKCTDRVVIALLLHHDSTIHFPDADKKETAKAYVEASMCSEWCDGFLLVDGTKFTLFQHPGLHGDTWFDKDGEYSISCQVCRDIIQQRPSFSSYLFSLLCFHTISSLSTILSAI
jgi:hypothetical protein